MAKSLTQKAAEKGININTVRARIRYGWSEHKALNTPVRQNKAQPESDPPKIIKPVPDLPKDKLGDAEDGFVLTIAIVLLGLVVFGLFWMLSK